MLSNDIWEMPKVLRCASDIFDDVKDGNEKLRGTLFYGLVRILAVTDTQMVSDFVFSSMEKADPESRRQLSGAAVAGIAWAGRDGCYMEQSGLDWSFKRRQCREAISVLAKNFHKMAPPDERGDWIEEGIYWLNSFDGGYSWSDLYFTTFLDASTSKEQAGGIAVDTAVAGARRTGILCAAGVLPTPEDGSLMERIFRGIAGESGTKICHRLLMTAIMGIRQTEGMPMENSALQARPAQPEIMKARIRKLLYSAAKGTALAGRPGILVECLSHPKNEALLSEDTPEHILAVYRGLQGRWLCTASAC
jgi:hypothetical protein